MLKKDQVYPHFALLYVRYVQVYRVLRDAYDQMIHPQKRRSLKPTLEAVMGRMIELKHLLRNMADVRRNYASFGDWLFLDEILEDLKLTMHDMEVPVPDYFVEERREELNERTKLLAALYDSYGILDDAGFLGHEISSGEKLSLEQAVRILQANERGRQGRERARFMREIRLQEERDKRGDAQSDPIKAAVLIQKVVRGHLGRVKAKKLRSEELAFIGMEPKPFDPLKDRSPMQEAEKTRELRRLRQQQHERDYQEAVVKMREKILTQEGLMIRDEIADKTREWFFKYREQTGKFPDFPDEEDGGSAKIFELPLPAPPPEDDGKKKKGGKGSSKSTASSKPAKKKGEEEEDVILPPSKFVDVLQSGLTEYSSMWAARDESTNKVQAYDPTLVRDMLRSDVAKEVRREVDDVLRAELENLQLALRKGKKGKKKKKKKKKKGGKKKGKKDITANRSVEDIYANLVKDGIVQRIPKVHLKDFVGDYNLLALTMREKEVFVDPSPLNVRQTIAETAILPLGSHYVHQSVPLLKAICLYGPRGSGKTMLAHAIATETGSNFINLSPENTAGKFVGLKQTSLMVHMAFKVAKVLAPSVIYIDNVEKVFAGKKKSDPNNSARIKKDIVKELKALTKEDRVLVVGCARRPFDCQKKNEKALKAFFGRFVYLARPDYQNRQVLLRHFINKAHPGGGQIKLGPEFDLESLAKITEGYTAGSLYSAVRATIPLRRFDVLDTKPLTSIELVNNLAKVDPMYKAEEVEYRKWNAKFFPKRIVEDEDAKKKKGKGKGKR